MNVVLYSIRDFDDLSVEIGRLFWIVWVEFKCYYKYFCKESRGVDFRDML